MNKTIRQQDLEFAGDILTEAEVADLRRFNGAIEHGPTTCTTPDQWWELQRLARVARGHK